MCSSPATRASLLLGIRDPKDRVAWGEYQTREAKQSRERGDLSSKPETVIRMKVDRAAKATVETEVTKAA